MNRRTTVGMSISALVMARIGHPVGLLCLLAVLPSVALAAAVSAVLRPTDGHTPTDRPGRTGAG
jgi:hypothetical protein